MGLEKKKHPVRMEWEKLYIETLIDTLRPFGNVLEVGFGLGHAASCIQKYHLKSHTIIESDSETAKEARSWASKLSNISIIQDTWQNALASLGSFDTIFFNDCSLENESEIRRSLYRENGDAVLRQGNELLSMVEKKFPQVTSIRYSDQDIDVFYQQVGQFNMKEMPRFLSDLKRNGQISEKQYETLVQKYNLGKSVHSSFDSRKQTDNMFLFLEDCLKNHMRKGSRFSCFSTTPTSKFESPQFFETIITNPDLDYQEKLIPVEVPESCKYYPFKEALVMVVEKIG